MTETIKLILADVNSNANKFWNATLNDDGSIDAEYGRVGVGKQTVHYAPHRGGKRFLDKKVKEKEKKGYREQKTVDQSGGGDQKTVHKSDLHKVARNQIRTSGHKILDDLVGKLVQENIHNITSHTNITFNNNTGLFQTPLGIVTPDGIAEARVVLGELADPVRNKDWGGNFNKLINDYLCLIPQNIGMSRFNPDSFFAKGQDSLDEQNNILDSLEASYKALTSQDKDAKVEDDEPEEKVFDLSLDLASTEETNRVKKLYEKTRQNKHASNGLGVANVFEVSIPFMENRFKEDIKPVMELWHGTSTANVLSILKSGLRVAPPSTAAIAGKMFGNGVYFSDQSTKSLNYAYGYWGGRRSSGSCFMFLAHVAMGNYYVPGNRHGLPKSGYDSTFAQAGKSGVINNEMIVYKEDQFKLIKLVEFK